jgi:hypothetical protein
VSIKRYAWLFAMAAIIGANAAHALAETTMLFDASEVAGLIETGLRVPQSGEYTVWAWVRGGSSMRLNVGDTRFSKSSTSTYRPFSWTKLGEAKLKANVSYPIELDLRPPEREDARMCIGWLALSTENNFNPERSFELMRVYPYRAGPVPDARVRETRTTRTTFEFPEFKTRQEWESRKKDVQRKILVSAGLWPMPQKTPLNVHVVEKLDRDGYTIENLYMQTMPGVYFPASLYRPKNKKGPFPAVINPHGHGTGGRMSEKRQARFVNFARQGYIVLAYNMMGYVDNSQMDHKFEDDTAYLWSVSVGGLQLWNSMRVLDFITSLPEVDTERVACTGASGGGTQTFLISAVDDRVKATAPVCMVSPFFQGGCVCENAPGLRYDTYSVEIAACAAPMPQILVGATGDWTDMTPDITYPDVRSVYRLTGDEDKLTYFYQEAEHNYDEFSRAAVYRWFGKWLLDETDPLTLRDMDARIEDIETLSVFDDERPMPDDALDEDGVVKTSIERAKQSIDKAWPKDKAGLDKFKDLMQPALADVLNVKQPGVVHAELMPRRQTGRVRRKNFTVTGLILNRPDTGDQVPAILYVPAGGAKKKMVNVVVNPDGKSALVDFATGEPGGLVTAMLNNDQTVLAIDTFLTGEHHSPFAATKRERFCAHFASFSVADEAIRVQDIVTAVTYAQQRDDTAGVNLVGLGQAGPWCLLANGLTPHLNSTIVDIDGFKNRAETEWLKRMNIPGILRVGDFDTATACAAPRRLLIHNTADTFDATRIKNLYTALGTNKTLTTETEQITKKEIANWLDNAS